MDKYGIYPTQLSIPFEDLSTAEENNCFSINSGNTQAKTIDNLLTSKDATLLFMRLAVSHTAKHEMPIVRPYQGEIPTVIAGLHRVISKGPYSVAPHFYFADERILRFWNQPFRTAQILSRFPVSIGMDFSMTDDMARPQKMHSSYLNKLWVAWLQSRGLAVIPNISFPNEWEEDYWLEGWPKRSVIAINSVGVLTHGNPDGWIEAVKRIRSEINPLHTVRYGPKIPGEETYGCTYFANDNNRYAYGR